MEKEPIISYSKFNSIELSTIRAKLEEENLSKGEEFLADEKIHRKNLIIYGIREYYVSEFGAKQPLTLAIYSF